MSMADEIIRMFDPSARWPWKEVIFARTIARCAD